MTGQFTESEVIARIEGLTASRLRAYTEARCIRPVIRDGHATFAEADVVRLQLLVELTSDLDLDEEGAALVLSLIDQIHGLRQELRLIAEAVAAEPDAVRGRICDRLRQARSRRA